jgi:hypothetical protein
MTKRETDSSDDQLPYLVRWREELQKQIDVIDAIQGLIDTWTARVAKMQTPPLIEGKSVEIRFNADRASRLLQFLVHNKEMPPAELDLSSCVEFICDGVVAESLEQLEELSRVKLQWSHLPALIGSDKQVQWATAIRLRVALLQPEAITGAMHEDYAEHWINKFKDVGVRPLRIFGRKKWPEMTASSSSSSRS